MTTIMTENNLRIGPAGIPTNQFRKEYEVLIDNCKNNGFTALELEFLNIKDIFLYPDPQDLIELNLLAKKYNIKLSIHAPYYINLATNNPNIIKNSFNHLLKTLNVSKSLNCPVVFHAGFYQKESKHKSVLNVIDNLKKFRKHLKNNTNLNLKRLFIETPGKFTAVGTIEELIEIAKVSNCLICIDWAHLYAKNPSKITKNNIVSLIKKIENELEMDYFHMHISGIKRNRNGEIKHIPFIKSFFPLDIVINTLKEIGIKGTLICESPNRFKNDTNYLLSLYKTGKLPFSKLKKLDDFIAL